MPKSKPLDARGGGNIAATGEPRTFVTFELGGQWLAVDVVNVREILDRQTVTPLPRASSEIEGIIDVRGVSVLVADLSRKLGIASAEESEDTRYLMFEFARQTIAVRADKVLEVAQIPDSEIETPSRVPVGGALDLVCGMTRSNARLVLLIDLDKVFPDEECLTDDIFEFE